MGIVDEKNLPKNLEQNTVISKINFVTVKIMPGDNDWSVEAVIDVFDEKGGNPEGIAIGLFYEGKRIGDGITDDWGNVIITMDNIPLPDPKNKEKLYPLKKWLSCHTEFISASKIEILKQVQNDIILRGYNFSIHHLIHQLYMVCL